MVLVTVPENGGGWRTVTGPSLPPASESNLFLLLGSTGRRASQKGHFSSDEEAVEADNEDELEPCDDDSDNAPGAAAGTSSGWADAMAKILNKKTPKSKPTILVKNRELEKEKEKLKQERLEKRKQVCRPALCRLDCVSAWFSGLIWAPLSLQCLLN